MSKLERFCFDKLVGYAIIELEKLKFEIAEVKKELKQSRENSSKFFFK